MTCTLRRLIVSFVLLSSLFAAPLRAQQEVVWVQIEAQPSLAEAQARARVIASRLQDVNGFSLGGGWYGIVLGPYTREDAEQVLRVYRAEGTIPRDSYIAFTSSFRQQFYPVGRNYLDAAPADVAETPPTQEPETPQSETDPLAEALAQTEAREGDAETPPQAPAPEPDPRASDETVAEARASEAQLDRSERQDLQIALKWAGFYNAAIDGAFGRGTRNSMAQWQAAQGYETTGVLTSRQRAELLGQYNAVLDGLDLQMVRDDKVGIEMLVPLGIMEFEKYAPPFAHFTPTGDIDARLLMISQKGDQNTLYGLYDVMQTLEIVPLEGARERNRASFLLTGENTRIVSHTEARLVDGAVKGFTLIWPAGDEQRRLRVLEEIRASFATLPGALDAAAGAGTRQTLDLLAGLEVRRPRLSRSGFYVSPRGLVLTSADVVEQCGRITLDSDHGAEVRRVDAAKGLALLSPSESLAPMTVARFSDVAPRIDAEVAVAGYPYEGLLSAPTLTFGTVAGATGLRGEADQKRLALSPQAGDVGGPVLASDGSILGMLMPEDEAGQKLPAGVSFALDSATLRAFLETDGLTAEVASAGAPMDPEDMSRHASGMTVLVSCWE